MKYVQIQNAAIQEMTLNEIFKGCMHGAMIEFCFEPGIVGKKVHPGLIGPDIVDLSVCCPKKIIFKKDHVDYGAMICQAVLNAGENKQNVYFQVNKKA